ncbi:MAG: GNAT family N-acetyltransferase [Candidatus Nanohaloarchaea archaeon]
MTETKFMEWDGVLLRPVEKEDKQFLRDLVQHPEVRNTIGRAPKPANLKEQENYVEEISEDEDAAYFLIEYEGEKAGTISIHGLENDYRRGEFGISIHPDFHNKGIGTKSVQMIVQYAFDTLNVHKVRGGYLEHNPPSKRIMEKAGMQEEGQERHYKYVDGEWKNVTWMSILEDEYYD